MFVYQKIFIDKQIEQNINYEVKNLDVDIYKDNFNYIDLNYLKEQCPCLFKWLSETHLNPVKAAIIITNANLYDKNSRPHIDTQTNSLALNFPISNCDNSETVFYTSSSPLETVVLKKPNGVYYTSLKNKDWTEIGRYVLDSAILLNTHVPHKIINPGNNKRAALSFRFDPDPWQLIK